MYASIRVHASHACMHIHMHMHMHNIYIYIYMAHIKQYMIYDIYIYIYIYIYTIAFNKPYFKDFSSEIIHPKLIKRIIPN